MFTIHRECPVVITTIENIVFGWIQSKWSRRKPLAFILYWILLYACVWNTRRDICQWILFVYLYWFHWNSGRNDEKTHFPKTIQKQQLSKKRFKVVPIVKLLPKIERKLLKLKGSGLSHSALCITFSIFYIRFLVILKLSDFPRNANKFKCKVYP